MLGHDIFDPEFGKRVLVDHAFLVARAEITKQAPAWFGNKLDATQRGLGRSPARRQATALARSAERDHSCAPVMASYLSQRERKRPPHSPRHSPTIEGTLCTLTHHRAH